MQIKGTWSQAGGISSYGWRPGPLADPNWNTPVAKSIICWDATLMQFVASTAAPIATGWSEPVSGRDFCPLWISVFVRSSEKSRLGFLPLTKSLENDGPGSSGWSCNDFGRDLNQKFVASEKERPRGLRVYQGRLSQIGVLSKPTKPQQFFEASSTRVGPNQAIPDLLQQDRSRVTSLPRRGTPQKHEVFALNRRNTCQKESTRDRAKKPG